MEKMENAWDFVVQHYPKYSSSDEIAENNDLQMIVDGEWDDDEESAANRLFWSIAEEIGEADENIVKGEAQKRLDESNAYIYEKAIEAYIESLNSTLVEEPQNFPNGFDDWQETHFVIVEAIVLKSQNEESQPKLIADTLYEFGTGGLWVLAKNLSDEFEMIHKGKLWGQDDEADYHDAIDKFLEEKFQ